MNPPGRFDYVKYDDNAVADQVQAKELCKKLESFIRVATMVNVLAVIGGIGVILIVGILALFIWTGIQRANGKNPFQ